MIHFLITNFISILYIVLTLQISLRMQAGQEIRRKFVHIMMGNWWFFCFFVFSNVWEAIFTPILFSVTNYMILSGKVKNESLTSLVRENEKPIGTIIYPISLLILVLFSYTANGNPYICGLGIMALTYGDAAAALVGTYFPVYPVYIWNNKKTLSGTFGMFFCTFFAVWVYIVIFFDIPYSAALIKAMKLSGVATICELVTPLGLDNLTIPLFTVLAYILLGN